MQHVLLSTLMWCIIFIDRYLTSPMRYGEAGIAQWLERWTRD